MRCSAHPLTQGRPHRCVACRQDDDACIQTEPPDLARLQEPIVTTHRVIQQHERRSLGELRVGKSVDSEVKHVEVFEPLSLDSRFGRLIAGKDSACWPRERAAASTSPSAVGSTANCIGYEASNSPLVPSGRAAAVGGFPDKNIRSYGTPPTPISARWGLVAARLV